jgi:periplasmic protein TonB
VSVSPPVKLRNFIGWAFLISIALHFALLPLGARFQKAAVAATPPPVIPFTIVFATPEPRPKPKPPVPMPRHMPHASTATSPKHHVAKAPHISNDQRGQARVADNSAGALAGDAPLSDGRGDGNGIDPNAGDAGSTPASPEAVVPPTAKPSCAKPHVDAQIVRAVEPEYPLLAQQQGLIGTTQIEVTLAETGAIIDARIYTGSGSRVLDDAALAAAKRSTYSSEIDDCKSVGGSYLFRAEFATQ